MNKRALIVIDIQNDYFANGKCPLEGMEAATANALRLIEASRKSNDLVVFVRHEFPDINAPFFAPGSEGSRIHSSIVTLKDEQVILKHQVNAFLETELGDVLQDAAIDEITICGAMSHMCIDAAARAASDFGFKVTVVHDACATKEQELNGTKVPAAQVHAAFMAALGFAYAKVVSTDEYLQAAASMDKAALSSSAS